MDKKQALLERNKLSRLLGTQAQDDNLERNIFLLKSLDMQKDIAAIINKVYTLIKQGQEDTQTLKDVKEEIRILLGALDKYQDAFGKEVKVFVSNFPDAVKEVRVLNTDDFKQEQPKEIRVSNLKEIKPEKHPDEVSIKRPVWYKDFDFEKLFKFSKDSSARFFSQVKTAIFNSFIRNVKPKEAIPVRLVTEDGEKFYRAGNVFVGGGGIDPVGLKDTSSNKINPAKEDGNLALMVSRLDMTLSELRDSLKQKFSQEILLFNNENTTDTNWHDSLSFDFDGHRTFCLFFNLTYTGNPTSIRLQAQFSPNNINWYDFSNSHWDYYKESKASVTAEGINKSLSEQLGGRFFRLRYKAEGADAVNYFTLSARGMVNK